MESCVNLYVAEEMGKGDSYVAPEPHFISQISLFSSSLPWAKFETFFEKKKLVNISGTEQLILLRLIALQELLCINDDSLLSWTKNQLYLFSFMQVDFKPRLPTKELLQRFRYEFDKVGLLKPFRKQCQRLINEHNQRLPPITADVKSTGLSLLSKTKRSSSFRQVSDTNVELFNVKNNSNTTCPNCSSNNVFKLKPSQEESSLPNISFSRCRFCGNTFRN
jgi:DNA-directed RNA polymerase subunit M/transcription elongation factor TFIIS